MKEPQEWQTLWSLVRGKHAACSNYRATGSTSSGLVGSTLPREERALEVTLGAGQRLRFSVGLPAEDQEHETTAESLVWGTPAAYFAWRPNAGTDELGSDYEEACNRCTLFVPRFQELIQLCRGRDLGPASPHRSRPEDVRLAWGPSVARLSWRSEDGLTRWQADICTARAAVLQLLSETDPDFDLNRALTVQAQRHEIESTESKRLERLRQHLQLEREEPRWQSLRLESEFDSELDENIFCPAEPRCA